MCRGLKDKRYEGGYRCSTHSNLGRTTGRAAKRAFGELTPETRARIEALPPEMLSLKASDRVAVVATSSHTDVWALALNDSTIEVRSALALNKFFRADPARLEDMAKGYWGKGPNDTRVFRPQPERVLIAIEGRIWKRDRRKKPTTVEA